MSDDTPQSILHLRHDFESVPDHQAMQDHLCQTLGCARTRVRNWREFTESLKDQIPDLITIHYAEIARAGYSDAAAFVRFVQGLVECIGFRNQPDAAPRPVAVGIDATCSRKFVTTLMSVDGVVGIYQATDLAHMVLSHRDMLAGKSHWPRHIIDDLPRPSRPTPVQDDSQTLTVLTPRQQQVMDLICRRGLSNKQIARVLSLSESTVKIHVSAIMRSHGVRNRTQLALAAGAGIQA